jgi:hypothetical protein
MQKSRVKKVLTAFLDAKGIIRHEFVPERQMVNGKGIDRLSSSRLA